MRNNKDEQEFIEKIIGLAKQPKTELEKYMQKLEEMNEKIKQYTNVNK